MLHFLFIKDPAIQSHTGAATKTSCHCNTSAISHFSSQYSTFYFCCCKLQTVVSRRRVGESNCVPLRDGNRRRCAVYRVQIQSGSDERLICSALLTFTRDSHWGEIHLSCCYFLPSSFFICSFAAMLCFTFSLIPAMCCFRRFR